MIGTSQLEKSYGGRTLFEGVSLRFNPGSRYGLVGANGSGKTTFLKILAGDETASGGVVSTPSRARVGVLRQDHFMGDDEIILDLAMRGDVEAWRALEEQSRIIDHGEGDPGRLAELAEVIAHADGYTLEARATSILEGLGIPIGLHKGPLSTLSGGFKLRVLLAQVLVGGPDVLLLDEPTNHLDILSIRWLEKFLIAYRGTALVISHDQRFLDNIATHILDVDYQTITPFTGNYTAFTAEKEAKREQQEASVARAEKIIAEKRAFVDRFGAKATKAKQAQSRLKQIEKIEVVELKTSSRREPMFRFVAERPSGREVLEVVDVTKSYGEKSVLRGVSLTVRRNEKVAIIGPNGLGKSTLLKIIMGQLEADRGEASLGHSVKVGYFAQDYHELLQGPAKTPLDFVWSACPSEAVAYVRGQLGRVLFSGNDVEKPVTKLSGGEAARLIFARLAVEKPNLLVLDEPTNHLDLEAISSLVEGLRAFEGTVIFVSHDRWFVSKLATRIVEITPDGLSNFNGTYAEYLERCGDDHLDADTVLSKVSALKATNQDRGTPVDNNLSWQEQKQRRNRLNALPAKRDKAMAAIEAAEARRSAIAATVAEPGFVDRTTLDDLRRLEREDSELVASIAAKTKEWEDLEAELSLLSVE